MQHISVMIIMQFLTGVTTASLFAVSYETNPSKPQFFLQKHTDPCKMTGTLLTDLNMQRSATASAAMSIVRCLGAGAAVAAVQPLADSIGLGWCFAIYAILLLIELPLAWLIQKNGMKWRSERTTRES